MFKEYLDKDYRDIIEIVELMEPIQSKLDLNKVPHFTTLHKFVTRLSSVVLNQIFQKVLRLFYTWDETIPVTAIDSSGFTSGHCSYYYSWRTGKRRRIFVKTSISVDTNKFIVTGFKISDKPVHDSKHAMTLLKHVIKLADQVTM